MAGELYEREHIEIIEDHAGLAAALVAHQELAHGTRSTHRVLPKIYRSQVGEFQDRLAAHNSKLADALNKDSPHYQPHGRGSWGPLTQAAFNHDCHLAGVTGPVDFTNPQDANLLKLENYWNGQHPATGKESTPDAQPLVKGAAPAPEETLTVRASSAEVSMSPPAANALPIAGATGGASKVNAATGIHVLPQPPAASATGTTAVKLGMAAAKSGNSNGASTIKAVDIHSAGLPADSKVAENVRIGTGSAVTMAGANAGNTAVVSAPRPVNMPTVVTPAATKDATISPVEISATSTPGATPARTNLAVTNLGMADSSARNIPAAKIVTLQPTSLPTEAKIAHVNLGADPAPPHVSSGPISETALGELEERTVPQSLVKPGDRSPTGAPYLPWNQTMQDFLEKLTAERILKDNEDLGIYGKGAIRTSSLKPTNITSIIEREYLDENPDDKTFRLDGKFDRNEFRQFINDHYADFYAATYSNANPRSYSQYEDNDLSTLKGQIQDIIDKLAEQEGFVRVDIKDKENYGVYFDDSLAPSPTASMGPGNAALKR